MDVAKYMMLGWLLVVWTGLWIKFVSEDETTDETGGWRVCYLVILFGCALGVFFILKYDVR